MNLYHDAYYICGCGRLSLMPVCPRCVPTGRPSRPAVPTPILPPVAPIAPAAPTGRHWEQVRAVADEAKNIPDYVKAGVFDVYCEQIGEETIFFAQSADKPLEGNVTPLYRFKRVTADYWRPLVLSPAPKGGN